MEIISKRDGPRKEDAKLKKLINDNRGTIQCLADHLSGGQYSAERARRQKAKEAPKAEGSTKFHILGGAAASDPEPYVSISRNGRVVIVDYATGKQIHFLGELRRVDGATRFLMATKANGFVAPLDDILCEKLADLDRADILELDGDTRTVEDTLKTEIAVRLEI